MELDAITQLRRYCFLGSFAPVYIHLFGNIDVSKYLPTLEKLCTAFEPKAIVQQLKDLLNDASLIRLDETVFVYAAYLTCELPDSRWRKDARQAFPILLRDEDLLFMFCKYSALIQKERAHKTCFTQTIRKAITAWYAHQTLDALQLMSTTQRSVHGFTHKKLIKLCHISDERMEFTAAIFFQPNGKKDKKAVVNEVNETESVEVVEAKVTASVAKEDEKETESLAKEVVASVAQNDSKTDKKSDQVVEVATTSATTNISSTVAAATKVGGIVPLPSLQKLRSTNNPTEALKIIQHFKLSYKQVPKHLLKHEVILEALIPTMSYLQVIKSWRSFARKKFFKNPRIFKLCQMICNNRKLLQESNIHPTIFLMEMHDLGARSNEQKSVAMKSLDNLKLNYIHQLYNQSFGQNNATGLRMHITINLQTNYKRKMLKNHKRLSFYDATIALAFAYFKREVMVDVYHWSQESGKLEQIQWTKQMCINQAMEYTNKIKIDRNTQLLKAPILNGMRNCDKKYDLFLSIVPTAGRGNPFKESKQLCRFLDSYREQKNSRAKYVIVDLLKHKKSMNYSDERVENILEICGLDDHTCALINNFALNRFG